MRHLARTWTTVLLLPVLSACSAGLDLQILPPPEESQPAATSNEALIAIVAIAALAVAIIALSSRRS